MSGIRWVVRSRTALPFFLPPYPADRLWMGASTHLLFVFSTRSFPLFDADVQQRITPKRSQQSTSATLSNSTTTLPVTSSSPSRNTPVPPSNRQGLDRSVSARTQPKPHSPAMSRSNTTKEVRTASDRHAPHHQQSLAQQPVHNHHHQQQQQPEILPTPTKSKVTATNSSADSKTHHKPKQGPSHAQSKPGTGLNPPGAAPRRREKKDKENDSEIIAKLRQICTDADPTRLYRSLVKIGAG